MLLTQEMRSCTCMWRNTVTLWSIPMFARYANPDMEWENNPAMNSRASESSWQSSAFTRSWWCPTDNTFACLVIIQQWLMKWDAYRSLCILEIAFFLAGSNWSLRSIDTDIFLTERQVCTTVGSVERCCRWSGLLLMISLFHKARIRCRNTIRLYLFSGWGWVVYSVLETMF